MRTGKERDGADDKSQLPLLKDHSCLPANQALCKVRGICEFVLREGDLGSNKRGANEPNATLLVNVDDLVIELQSTILPGHGVKEDRGQGKQKGAR